MIILRGLVIGTQDRTFGQQGSKQYNVRIVQVMLNGGSRKALVDVVDWDRRDWKSNEKADIPVSLKATVSKDGGRAYINYTAISKDRL